MSIFFSYIIPCYNSAKSLKKCIESVPLDSGDSEIVIVNDKSNDDTQEIIYKLKKKQKKKIKIYNNTFNKGPGISRNRAIEKSSGKYLIFLDSDDTVEKKGIKKIKKNILKYNFPNLVLGMYSKENYPYTNQFLFKNIRNEKILSRQKLIQILNKEKTVFEEAWPFIVKRKLLIEKKILFPKIRINEDQVFTNSLLFNIDSILLVKELFYYHKNREKSLSKEFGLSRCTCYLESFLLIMKVKTKLKKSNFIYLNYFKNLLKIIIDNFTTSFILSNNIKFEQISLKFKNKFNKFDKKYFENELVDNRFKNLILFFNFSNLKLYENTCSKRILDFVYKVNKKNLNIYLYCKTALSQSLYSVLKKENKNKLKKIIDDKYIFKRNKNINKKSLIIICHHSLDVCKKIKKNLKKNKFENIVYFGTI